MNEPGLHNAVLSVFTDAALVDDLTRRGWRCTKEEGQGWETPGEFARRHGVAPSSFCRLLSRNGAIPGLELDRAKGGRLRMVRGSAATENWMRARKKDKAGVYDY